MNHPPDLRRGRGVESNGQCNCHPGPTRQRGSEGQEVVECPTMMQQVTGHMGALRWRLPAGQSKMRWGGPCGRARSCWSNRSGKCSSCSVTNLAAAGLLALPASRNLAEAIDATGFVPSGKRPAETVAKRISAAKQPTRAALPQLLPDGPPPEHHLDVALLAPPPALSPPARQLGAAYAFEHQPNCADVVNQHCLNVVTLLEDLAQTVLAESAYRPCAQLAVAVPWAPQPGFRA